MRADERSDMSDKKVTLFICHHGTDQVLLYHFYFQTEFTSIC